MFSKDTGLAHPEDVGGLLDSSGGIPDLLGDSEASCGTYKICSQIFGTPPSKGGD